MKYFSLFSGIGGFELGIGPKHTNVGFSEIDKYAIEIYSKRFPKHKNYGDITKIKENKLPDFDLLVGGFPCQSFSIAGKRKGFSDTRGTLFFDICRLLKAKRSRLLLLENVKGLLSHDQGRTFEVIISALNDLGYDCQWQVLNSKDFGVPQNRERVLIAGHLRGTRRPKVFPFAQNAEANFNATSPVKKMGNVAQTLTARQFANWGGNYIQVGTLRNGRKNEAPFRKMASNLSPTLKARARQDGDMQPVIIKSGAIRRLTPIECERLQGFPDNWTEGISDTQRYKTLGNAVTTNVIRAVTERLLK